MKQSISGLLTLLLLTLLILVPTVSAVQITESPDVVQKGDQITLTITDLPDAASFSLLIGGKFAVTPGERFSFETRNFNMPFALNKGTISATTQGTKTTSFSVAKGDAIVQIGNAADSNGYFTISKEYEIGSGVYDYLTLGGRARTDTSVITSSMNLLGTKKGATNSAITFTIDGIDNGEVYLTALVNGDQVLYKKVTVGSGISSPTPTETSAEPTETETTAGGDATATPTSPPDSIIGTITTATTATATKTSTQADSSQATATFSSADRMVKLTTQGIDYAALLMVSEANPPADWIMVSDAYKIAPDSLEFDTPGTISFSVPATTANYAYFIAQLQNDQWVVVPSTAGSGTIDAEVDHTGTYALMAYTAESTIPATTGAAGKTTPDVTATMSGNPKVASIAQAQAAASATTKPAPLDLLPVLGALGICSVAVLIIRKRS
jgi:hypothetical protein